MEKCAATVPCCKAGPDRAGQKQLCGDQCEKTTEKVQEGGRRVLREEGPEFSGRIVERLAMLIVYHCGRL